MPFVIGALYAGGFYLMMRHSIVKLIIGLALLSHGSNLLIFLMGGLTRARSPVVPPGAGHPVPPFADPLPQALILTAIVIGFGVMAFAVVLIRRAHEIVGTDDLDELQSTDM
jgi:multicomponent Na+:H+ antiporter subunit C